MAGLTLTVVLNLCFVALAAASCSLNLAEFDNEPVILVSTNGQEYSLFNPTGRTTKYAEGTQFHMVCSGRSNQIKSTRQQAIDLTCKNNALKDSSGRSYTIKQLSCNEVPESRLEKTNESCGPNNRGKILVIGFPYLNNKFATQFIVCYDQSTETVFYTHSIINGKAIKYSIRGGARKSFNGYGTGLSTNVVNNLYKTKNEIKQFQYLFGNNQNYVSTKNIISRGHLTPDADGVTRYEQLATYYFVNVKPQYQVINGGNWVHVEETARDLAAELGEDLDSYNGVIGTLELKANNGQMKKAYLDRAQKFDVPEFYFKVLLNKSSDAGIVFITSNNPFLENVRSAQLCRDVCANAKMSYNKYSDPSKGYTICCTVSDFLKLYSGLPSEVTASKLLSY